MKFIKLLIALCVFLFINGCYKEELINLREGLPDWSTETHGKVSYNYKQVFDDNSVKRIKIVFNSQDWANLNADLTLRFGKFGDGGNSKYSESYYFPCQFYVGEPENERQWYHVGIRLKGNESINASWSAGNYKFPFWLNFDKFEDKFRVIKNQTYYGFDQLYLSPNYMDHSMLREKLASQLLEKFNVPATKSAFYRIYLDYGEGEKYLGVYNMLELPEDGLLNRLYGTENGNFYKPETTFQDNAYSEDAFPNKSNFVTQNGEDVKAFLEILHSPLRDSDPNLWMAEMEAVFDVNLFLKFVAATVCLQNPDAYGFINNNFYIFNNPTDKKFKWVTWNQSKSFNRNPELEGIKLDILNTSDNWPLIKYLVQQPKYLALYKQYLNDFIATSYNESTLFPEFEKYHKLIEPYVIIEQPGSSHISNIPSDFYSGLNTLKTNVTTRINEVNSYLAK